MTNRDVAPLWTLAQIPNRHWSRAEIDQLRTLAEKDLNKLEIARVLERTSNAVEIQARKHGIKLRRMNSKK